jgi:hypothetical protein
MRRSILSLLAGLAVVTATPAQFPVQVAVPNAGPTYAPQVASMEAAPYVGPLWTVDLQGLAYFVKPVRFNSAVLGTTVNPDLNLGAQPSLVGVTDPSYVGELGPGDKSHAPYYGARVSLTHALPVDFARTAYTEIAGFWIPDQGTSRRISASPDGNPAILLPFTTTTATAFGPPGNYSAVVAGFIDPFHSTGAAVVTTGTQIWGGEWNVAGPVFQGSNFGLEALVGLRYLGMEDQFRLSATSTTVDRFSFSDRFATWCHFYGMQAGGRVLASFDRWAAMFSAKVGMGDTNSRLTVSGATLTPAGTQAGGFYSSLANIGDRATDRFGVVVDLNLAIRFAVCQTVGVSVGYNFLDWTGVLRASDQLPGAINPAASPVLNPAGAALVPVIRDRDVTVSSLWMHGVNFGVDFRW